MRQALLRHSVGLLSAGASLVWAHGEWSRQREVAAAAARDLAACSALAHEIEQQQDKPHLARSESIGTTELAHHVDESARSAGLDPENAILRITPQLPRRLSDVAGGANERGDGGSYVERVTQLDLTGITLRQLIAFFTDLCTRVEGLRPTFIRLVAPHEQLVGERWSVEVAVSVLVYAPEVSDEA